MRSVHLSLLLSAYVAANSCFAQQSVTAISTTTSSLPGTSYTAVKGGGVRTPNNTLVSDWDSTGTSFTINFTSGTSNRVHITQFNATGHANPLLPISVTAAVKIRRQANAYVNNTSNIYYFWAQYNSIPANGATTGTFDLQGPEVTDPEVALLTDNLNTGYDNIFQNTIQNPQAGNPFSEYHAGNIERVDYIISGGLKPLST